jgi:hypothetical protein
MEVAIGVLDEAHVPIAALRAVGVHPVTQLSSTWVDGLCGIVAIIPRVNAIGRPQRFAANTRAARGAVPVEVRVLGQRCHPVTVVVDPVAPLRARRVACGIGVIAVATVWHVPGCRNAVHDRDAVVRVPSAIPVAIAAPALQLVVYHAVAVVVLSVPACLDTMRTDLLVVVIAVPRAA